MMVLEVNPGDTAWVLVSAAMVLLMTPALAFFYGGMVRSKSVLNMIMMSMVSMGVVGVLWVLVGFSMAFGDSLGGVVGNPLTFLGLDGRVDAVAGAAPHEVPLLVFAGFQAAFAIIAVAIVSGAVADRMKFAGWIFFTALWTLFGYAPVAHWVFALNGLTAPRGGWLANNLGAIDFAGGTAIHVNAGMAALVLALALGPRIGFGTKPFRPHNLTLVMLGSGLLWFGWFGFNAGSALSASPTAGLAWVNTLAAPAAGMLAWIAVERVRDGRPTSLGAASGLVAGLVAITPACAAVTPWAALVFGAVAGMVCPLALGLKRRFGFDDSLDVVGVHLVGGLLGTLLIGLLAKGSLSGGRAGLLYGGGVHQLRAQLLGTVAVMAYSAVVTTLVVLVVRATVGLRITHADEAAGIDLTEHAENGYDLSRIGYSGYRVAQTLVVPATTSEESAA